MASKAQAQGDKVDALKATFIKKKMELSTNESDKFWPVYNEYNDKVKALRKNFRESIKKAPDNLSDKEAEELYQLDIKSKESEVDLHKQYNEKIKSIIGVKKIIILRKAEEEFKKILFETAKGN
jgi:hypothetical protein